MDHRDYSGMGTFKRHACYLKWVSDCGYLQLEATASFPAWLQNTGQYHSSSYSLHMCRLPASFLLCMWSGCRVRLRHIVKADLASPESVSISIPRPLLSISGAAPCSHATPQPPPPPPCNTISPINSSPFITHNRMTNKPMPMLALACCSPRRVPWSKQLNAEFKVREVAPLHFCDGAGLAAWDDLRFTVI